MALKIHEVVCAKSLEFKTLPAWMQTFLERVKENPYSPRPPALIIHKEQGRDSHDALVVMMLADLLELVKANEHPMQSREPHGATETS